MTAGIQVAKKTKFPNMTCSLNKPIAALDRLSRNLNARGFTDEASHQICRLASRKVLLDTLIPIDPGMPNERSFKDGVSVLGSARTEAEPDDPAVVL
jgi:hypothetical protein